MTQEERIATSPSINTDASTNMPSSHHEPEWWSWADIVSNASRLGIPHFQRGAVWDSGNRTALLESMYEQSPCGAFVMWTPKVADDPFRHGVPLRKFAADTKPLWLVDGQQRTRALLDIFQEIIDPAGDKVCRALVHEADLDDLRDVGAALRNAGGVPDQDINTEDDPRLWIVVLPAMTVFDHGREEPYFRQRSEARNVRRGSMFRRLSPRSNTYRNADGITRPMPPLPVGMVPLATLLSRNSVFHDASLRELAVTALQTFENGAPDFETLDHLLPWGPQFVTGHAFHSVGNDQASIELIRWKTLYDRRRESAVGEMVRCLRGLFAPDEWTRKVIEPFKDMLHGNRFAVGWLPSSDVSAAIDAYVRINRAGIRVRAEERALAMLSRAWPHLLDELAQFIQRRDGNQAAVNQRALLGHESDRQMGFGFWMTVVTRYTALALLGSSARRWLGVSALDKDTFEYRLDRVGPKETEAGKKTWARQYADPGDLIRECTKRASSALILVDAVLSEELHLDHRMARPSARALYPLLDLLYRAPAGELDKLREDAAFRTAIARLLHWTLLAPYFDQPSLEKLIIDVHGIDEGGDGTPLTCWGGGSDSVGQELRQAFGRYQRALLELWPGNRDVSMPPEHGQSIQSRLTQLAARAFKTEVGNARSLQHPAVGWLYAIEQRRGAREFSWKAQTTAFHDLHRKIGVSRGEDCEEALRRSVREDLYPEKQHIVPFSDARLIINNKGGTRATASRANDIGNLTWLSHRQNGFEALGGNWTAMDRDLDAANLDARGMFASVAVNALNRDVLGIYKELQDMMRNKEAWDDHAQELFGAFCEGRKDWMTEQMRDWLAEPLQEAVIGWLGNDLPAK